MNLALVREENENQDQQSEFQSAKHCPNCLKECREQFTHCPDCQKQLPGADGIVDTDAEDSDLEELLASQKVCRKEQAQANEGLMISGALWAIGGTVVTALTYAAAQDGGVYIIAWGAILFGAIDFLRGFCGMCCD